MEEQAEKPSEEESWWIRLRRFLLHDLWTVDLSSLSFKRGFLVRMLRVSQLVFRGFREDDLPLRASALTFITLISLVPLLAFSFSMLKGLGGGEAAFQMLETRVAEMPAGLENMKAFAESLLETLRNTSFFALGGAAVLLLLWSVIQVMGSIEDSFNRVWGITTSRSLLRKITDYTGTLVFIVVLAAAAMAGGASMSIHSIVARMESIPVVEQMRILKYVPMVKIVTFAMIWLGFMLLYMFMPNTRVRFGPAMSSGLVAGLMWVIWQNIYMSAQLGVARYNVLFGTFAAIPIFLAWLYVSWVIVLLGAEFSFALQNSSTFQLEQGATRASVTSKVLLALAVLTRAAESLELGASAFRSGTFAKERGVSIRLVNEVVRLLTRSGLLVEVGEGEGEYVMLRAPGVVRVKDVLDAFLREGSRPEELGLVNLRPAIRNIMRHVDEGLNQSMGELTIHDLLEVAS